MDCYQRKNCSLAIIKADYHNFKKYKNEIESPYVNENPVSDAAFFCLDLDRKTLNELIDMIYVADKNNIEIELKNV